VKSSGRRLRKVIQKLLSFQRKRGNCARAAFAARDHLGCARVTPQESPVLRAQHRPGQFVPATPGAGSSSASKEQSTSAHATKAARTRPAWRCRLARSTSTYMASVVVPRQETRRTQADPSTSRLRLPALIGRAPHRPIRGTWPGGSVPLLWRAAATPLPRHDNSVPAPGSAPHQFGAARNKGLPLEVLARVKRWTSSAARKHGARETTNVDLDLHRLLLVLPTISLGIPRPCCGPRRARYRA